MYLCILPVLSCDALDSCIRVDRSDGLSLIIVGHRLRPVAQNGHVSRVSNGSVYKPTECGCSFGRACMYNCMTLQRRFLKYVLLPIYIIEPAAFVDQLIRYVNAKGCEVHAGDEILFCIDKVEVT